MYWEINFDTDAGEQKQTYRDTWKETVAYFSELVTNREIAKVDVIAYWDNGQIVYDGEPVLTYRP